MKGVSCVEGCAAGVCSSAAQLAAWTGHTAVHHDAVSSQPPPYLQLQSLGQWCAAERARLTA